MMTTFEKGHLLIVSYLVSLNLEKNENGVKMLLKKLLTKSPKLGLFLMYQHYAFSQYPRRFR